MGLSVDAQTGDHAHLRRPLTTANPAVQQEFAAANGPLQVSRSGFDKAKRNFLHDCRCRSRFKAHDRRKLRGAILRYSAEYAHRRVRACLKHDGFEVREVDENFEALRGRNSELLPGDRR